MKIKKILLFFSAIFLCIPSITAIACSAPRPNQKGNGVDDDIVNKTYLGRNYNEKSLVQTLKKPDTWQNLWENILLVNELNYEDFDQKINDNLEKIRQFYFIDNHKLNDIIGDIEYNKVEKISNDWELIWSDSKTNLGNEDIGWEVTYSSDMRPNKAIFNSDWNLISDLEGLKINFASSKHRTRFYMDLSPGNQIEFQFPRSYWSEASKGYILKPGRTVEAKIYSRKNLYEITGFISYTLNWQKRQHLILLDNQNKKFKIDLAWSFWAIAQGSKVEHFTKESQDLFFWDTTKFTTSYYEFPFHFTIPLKWQIIEYRDSIIT